MRSSVLLVIESFIFEMGASCLLPAPMKLCQATILAHKTSLMCDRPDLLDQDTQMQWNSLTVVSSLLRCHFLKGPFLIILLNVVPCVLPTPLSAIFLSSAVILPNYYIYVYTCLYFIINLLPVPAGKVDQVPRTCTAGLRKETKAGEIYNKEGVERFRHISTEGRSLTPTLFSVSYLYRRA